MKVFWLGAFCCCVVIELISWRIGNAVSKMTLVGGVSNHKGLEYC